MDRWMDGWQEVLLELQALAASAAAAGALGGEGIKALHINTIMKEKKKKKVRRCDEEMENGMRPFCVFFPPPKSVPPSLTSLSFLDATCRSLSPAASFKTSLHSLQFPSLQEAATHCTADNRSI